MQILGIGDHVSAGSAIVRDGKVISAINDERIVREKMVFGMPRESIKAQLDMHGLTPKDVDGIAIATERQHFYPEYTDFKDGWFGLERSFFKKTLFDVASQLSRYRNQLPFLQDAYYLVRQPAFAKRRKGLTDIFRNELGFDCPITFYDHHFCHATSAYYTSGMRNATVVTVDGGGDGRSGKIYKAEDGKFQELTSISTYDSLGAFYSYITQICGFKAGRHEGKITGLAAYGEPVYIPQLKEMLRYEKGNLTNVAHTFFWSSLDKLEELLPADFSHRDIAASVQDYSEELVTDMVKYWIKETGYGDVAMAGGVFANVKINQRVHEVDGVDSVFIHPGMTDEGVPLGAAFAMYYEASGAKYDPGFEAMPHVYLGPDYTDEEIGKELAKQGVEATLHEDGAEPEIARLLSESAVVARFNGRMEYGPRALGNRTILYRPDDPSVNLWMNDALKRTEFMPFAPIVMTEHAEKCFQNIKGATNAARFMTITFDCTEWMAEVAPGVVHIDNTARPQLVSERDNPSMHKILQEYEKLSGLPCLINTSFNMHEEPIVCTPSDAIRAFKLGNIDYLAIGNWIAKHETPVERRTDQASFQANLDRKGVGNKFGPKEAVVKEMEPVSA